MPVVRLPYRKPLRLPGYDYTLEGAYFVTLCVLGKECLLGEVDNLHVRLSTAGEIVRDTWFGLPAHYPRLILDVFVIMPNHVHAIIVLTNDAGTEPNRDFPGISDSDSVGEGLKPSPTQFIATNTKPSPTQPIATHTKPSPTQPASIHGLPEIVRALRTFSARKINDLRDTPGTAIWQRSFYEHIIRNDTNLTRVREYILNNPAQWALDKENPSFGQTHSTCYER